MSDADEMILAGSGPQHSNPIDALHSRTSFVFVVDSLIVTFFFYQLFGQLAFIPAFSFWQSGLDIETEQPGLIGSCP